ncbi:MAG TPA: HDOD domain-containing protein [Polyangia bacterium]|jgi:HD-like signal output (HDOD) protein|nr:HDOD domain-containing protein [Polyangia bacterium]
MAADPGSRSALSNAATTSGRATTGNMNVTGARSTQTISIAQTAPLRIDHLADNIFNDTKALRRSLPEVAAEALELCSRSSADANAMERTLARDPFISAQVISIANSALFAPKMPILGVRDAVVRIGLDALRDVVLMVVTNSTMFRVRGFEGRVENIRRGMLASASAARQLAKAMRVESEYGFLAGLLHNIGELVLLERCVHEGIVTPQLLDDPTEGQVLRDRIHFHHTRVGAALCRAWKLPAGVTEAAEFHHDYSAGGKRRFAAQLIAAADAIGEFCMPGSQSVEPTTVPAVQELKLPAEQIKSISASVKSELPGLFATGSTAQPR